MLVAQLAARTGASARSIRHYDRLGLLTSTRASNGYRHFPDEAAEEVRQIRRLLGAGIGVVDIKALQPCLTSEGEFDGCPLARKLLAKHIDRLQRRMAQDMSTLSLLVERQDMMPRR